MRNFQVAALDGTSQELWAQWKSRTGPPVPVKIKRIVWETLLEATRTTVDPATKPRVFRLFMRRGLPRQVVRADEIEDVRKTESGIIRWNERGYPSLSQSERKGGNAFIRGDTELKLDDAWWMGRELTDLRILLALQGTEILFSAWWVRGGTGKSDSTSETDGELWPVKLLIDE